MNGEIDLNLIDCGASQICIFSYTGTPCRAKTNFNSPTCNVPPIITPPVWETTVPTTIPTTVPTTIPTTVPTTIPTTIPTTAPTTVPTTTTTVNPTNFCSTRAVGRYAYGTGCRQYIYCYINAGVTRGAIYTCVGTTLFDPIKQICSTTATCV